MFLIKSIKLSKNKYLKSILDLTGFVFFVTIKEKGKLN